MFLQSMLFFARFLLLISSSIFMLFPSNRSSCFLTAVPSFSLDSLYTTDLMVFQISSSVFPEISASLFFNEAWMLSLIVDFDRVGCELPEWPFALSHLPSHTEFGCGLDRNKVSTVIDSFHCSCVQKVWQITMSVVVVFDEVPVFRSWVHSRMLVDLLVLDYVLFMTNRCSVQMNSSILPLVLAFHVLDLAWIFSQS